MLLEAQVPAVSCAQAEAIVREHFGLIAQATLLDGERDRNFRIATGSAQFLLKISNTGEDPAVCGLQTEVLRYLRVLRPELPVPRLLPARNGDEQLVLSLAGMPHVTRLMSFLPGQAASLAPRSTAMTRAIARSLASLDLGLQRFEHAVARHDLLWDVSNAQCVRPMLECVPAAQRGIAGAFLATFELRTAPVLRQLRSQVIHNDFNPNNVLVSPECPTVTGIIDFGDMMHAPLIGDPATAAAYQLLTVADPLARLCEFAGAYHERLPLQAGEVEVLFDMVAARLVMIVAITHWRALLHPDNRSYILRNTPAAMRCLEQLHGIRRSHATAALRRACGLE